MQMPLSGPPSAGESGLHPKFHGFAAMLEEVRVMHVLHTPALSPDEVNREQHVQIYVYMLAYVTLCWPWHDAPLFTRYTCPDGAILASKQHMYIAGPFTTGCCSDNGSYH